MTVLNLVKQRYETITKAQNKINKERVFRLSKCVMSSKRHKILGLALLKTFVPILSYEEETLLK